MPYLSSSRLCLAKALWVHWSEAVDKPLWVQWAQCTQSGLSTASDQLHFAAWFLCTFRLCQQSKTVSSPPQGIELRTDFTKLGNNFNLWHSLSNKI